MIHASLQHRCTECNIKSKLVTKQLIVKFESHYFFSSVVSPRMKLTKNLIGANRLNFFLDNLFQN